MNGLHFTYMAIVPALLIWHYAMYNRHFSPPKYLSRPATAIHFIMWNYVILLRWKSMFNMTPVIYHFK